MVDPPPAKVSQPDTASPSSGSSDASAPSSTTGGCLPHPKSFAPPANLSPSESVPQPSVFNRVPSRVLVEDVAQRRADNLIAASDAAAARAARYAADVKDRLQLTSLNEDCGDNNSPPSIYGGRKRSTRTIASMPDPVGGRTGGKGLRHFSMKVCEKVESKGRTTYNEVADELVKDFSNPEVIGSQHSAQFDEKNIRRRVYDALNVLMAMDIIAKEKKEIHWCGLPCGGPGSSLERAQAEQARLRRKVEHQHALLEESLVQQRSLRNLVLRNRDTPLERALMLAEGGVGPTPLQLPFIIIQAGHEAQVELQMSDDSTQVQFDFHNTPFKIHGDDELLKLMGLHIGNLPLPDGVHIPTLAPLHPPRSFKLPTASTPQGSAPRASKLTQPSMDLPVEAVLGVPEGHSAPGFQSHASQSHPQPAEAKAHYPVKADFVSQMQPGMQSGLVGNPLMQGVAVLPSPCAHNNGILPGQQPQSQKWVGMCPLHPAQFAAACSMASQNSLQRSATLLVSACGLAGSPPSQQRPAQRQRLCPPPFMVPSVPATAAIPSSVTSHSTDSTTWVPTASKSSLMQSSSGPQSCPVAGMKVGTGIPSIAGVLPRGGPGIVPAPPPFSGVNSSTLCI